MKFQRNSFSFSRLELFISSSTLILVVLFHRNVEFHYSNISDSSEIPLKQSKLPRLAKRKSSAKILGERPRLRKLTTRDKKTSRCKLKKKNEPISQGDVIPHKRRIVGNPLAMPLFSHHVSIYSRYGKM